MRSAHWTQAGHVPGTYRIHTRHISDTYRTETCQLPYIITMILIQLNRPVEFDGIFAKPKPSCRTWRILIIYTLIPSPLVVQDPLSLVPVSLLSDW